MYYHGSYKPHYLYARLSLIIFLFFVVATVNYIISRGFRQYKFDLVIDIKIEQQPSNGWFVFFEKNKFWKILYGNQSSGFFGVTNHRYNFCPFFKINFVRNQLSRDPSNHGFSYVRKKYKKKKRVESPIVKMRKKDHQHISIESQIIYRQAFYMKTHQRWVFGTIQEKRKKKEHT